MRSARQIRLSNLHQVLRSVVSNIRCISDASSSAPPSTSDSRLTVPILFPPSAPSKLKSPQKIVSGSLGFQEASQNVTVVNNQVDFQAESQVDNEAGLTVNPQAETRALPLASESKGDEQVQGFKPSHDPKMDIELWESDILGQQIGPIAKQPDPSPRGSVPFHDLALYPEDIPEGTDPEVAARMRAFLGKLISVRAQLLDGPPHGTSESVSDFVNRTMSPLRNAVHGRRASTILREQTDPEVALAIYDWSVSQNRFEVIDFFFQSIIGVMERSRNFSAVEALATRVWASGVELSERTATSLARLFAHTNNAAGARKLLEELRTGRNPSISVGGWNAMLKYLEGLLGVDDLLDAYKIMVDASGVKPDHVTFLQLATALGRVGRAEGVAWAHLEAEKYGCLENVVVYNAFIDTYGSLSLTREMEAMVREMEGKGIQPDRFTFSSLITAFERTGNMDKVSELHAAMRSQGIEMDAVVYKCLLRAYSFNQMVPQTEATLDEMVASGLIPDESAFWRPILLFGTKGDWDRVRKILLLMKSHGIRRGSFVFNALIRIHASNSDIAKMESTLFQMEASGNLPNVVTYNYLMTGYSKVLAVDKVDRVFEILSSRKCVGGPNVMSYNIAIGACARVKDVDHALNYFDRMKKDGIEADTYTIGTMMELFSSTKRYDEALQLFLEFRKSKLPPSIFLLNAMLEIYAAMNDIPNLLKIFQEIERSKVLKPDSYTIRFMIKALYNAKDFNRLLQFHTYCVKNKFYINRTCSEMVKEARNIVEDEYNEENI